MLDKINLRSSFIIFGVPLGLILSLFLFTKSALFYSFPKELSLGITIDLVCIIPFVYFLLIRKKEVPKITVVSLFFIGVVSASCMLPERQQGLLSQIKTYISPIVEVAVLGFLFFKIRKTVKEFKKLNTKNLDFFDAIQIACKESFPQKVASLLAAEIAVIYYVFFNWKKKVLKKNEFSNYKENGLVSLLLAFLLVVFTEMLTIHTIVEKWSALFAWVLTISSMYSGLQIVALIKSLSKRPFIIDSVQQQIVFRFGFFSKAIVPFKAIKETVSSSKDLPEDKSVVYFSTLGGLGGHNTILHLNEEIAFESFYGFKKQAISLALFIDDKNAFVASIKSEIIKN